MLSEELLQQRWSQLKIKMASRLGNDPCLDDILVFIGITEAMLPPKQFTEKEKADLRQMAICTVLVPARYYQLLWVDATGWPHYNELQRVPEMNADERERFLMQYVLLYAEKNKLV
ncbi:MAG: hypothetical protein JNN00_10450 [Chitinophagaceae bacterium]|nr:hypothetical protein [Chitinophagaceae bacterium]